MNWLQPLEKHYPYLLVCIMRGSGDIPEQLETAESKSALDRLLKYFRLSYEVLLEIPWNTSQSIGYGRRRVMVMFLDTCVNEELHSLKQSQGSKYSVLTCFCSKKNSGG